jgi:hypothetical protein
MNALEKGRILPFFLGFNGSKESTLFAFVMHAQGYDGGVLIENMK